ncbi:HYD1 signature containing ADP-ribosyltransferase family protein [Pseudogracilibacillus sp. SO30301A]|uniref:HYD1 signature containing ADP-ribosyltransferase family protein n=1 Tax=Pseudogracilibacillus sp. SO30301A TaxID=3098291 RepID=UPI00300E30B1
MLSGMSAIPVVGNVATAGKYGSKANKLSKSDLQFFGNKDISKQPLYHYTNENGLNGILSSNKLNPSLKTNNPKDVRYGDGQYLIALDF